MSRVFLYVEGGGAETIVRKAFHDLLSAAGFAGKLPRIVACGSREEAYKKFRLAATYPDSLPVLLVDSEDPVNGKSVWTHLLDRDGWVKPARVNDLQGYLMVTSMETWLMADPQALQRFFHRGFDKNKLLGNHALESRTRQDVQKALYQATRNCSQSYKKGPVSFKALGFVDPATLKVHLPHFRQFIDGLGQLL